MESDTKHPACEFTVGGMDCADCARKIEKKIRSLGYTVEREKGVQTSTFVVRGMDCADEERVIRKKLGSMDGVEGLRFNLVARRLTVIHHLTEQRIVRTLREIGFEAIPVGKERGAVTFWDKNKRLILTVISGVFATAGIVHNQIHVPDALTIPFYLVAMVSGGFYVAKRGLLAAKNLSLDMNFLMTAAVMGAAAIGEWDEGAMIIFLFALANLLETSSMDRARKAITSLMDLSPPTALVRRNGEEKRLAVEEIAIGDLIIVKPGERIPMDGVV
ncbi:MAG: cation transporter, partial [bacterium]